jgi:GTP-binding protein
MTKFKNLAIIAHVDHGKTTLVDAMLRQSGEVRDENSFDRMMDSNDLEKERGITILAKCTAMHFEDYKLNIVDTPGHADFGGEVERVLSMVDGVVLLVDAAEGPMPQTKFVLTKALALGLKPIVVINKVDRSDARVSEVLDEVLDLFIALEATDEQLDFKVLYASGRNGWANLSMEDEPQDLKPLFRTIIQEFPAPKAELDAQFKMLVTILDYDQYLGRILIGKIYSGKIARNKNVKSLNLNNGLIENAKVTKLLSFSGLQRVAVEEAVAGDIIAIAGFSETSVADTICDLDVTEGIKSTPIDPPTMTINIGVNDSPLAGLDGSKVTSRLIRDRLTKESKSNVAITVNDSADGESFEVGGRGELQLGVLIETLRREGFELSVSRPKIIYKYDEKGAKLEPFEEVVVDVDDDYTGAVIETISSRGGEMTKLTPSGTGKTRLIFTVPTRALIGYHGDFLSLTRGTGVMNRLFLKYDKAVSTLAKRRNGVLISMADGVAVAYALWNLEDRGVMCVAPQDKVYQGMVIGIHNKDNDLEVNPIKGKQLSNMRASGKDEAVKLQSPKVLTIEEAISFIEDDEMLEVTPKIIRLRKRYLDPNMRKKMSREN